ELEADLLEDRVGVVLDEREAVLAEDLERGEGAGQERDVLGVRREPGGLSRGPAAAAAPRVVVHHSSSVRPTASTRRRRRSPRPAEAPSPVAGRAGRATTADRLVYAAVRCGKAIASTKCSWKRGSTAVSIFSTVRTTSSISARAAPERSAMSAPVPAAFPAGPTWARSQSGISPRTIACVVSIWL